MTVGCDVDAERLLKHLRRDGITLYVGDVRLTQVKIAIEAPEDITISREELIGRKGGNIGRNKI
jgi:hypothetical protein